MELELWGIHSSFFFRFPVRLSGFFVLALDLVSLAILILYTRNGERKKQRIQKSNRSLFYIVLIFSVLVPQFLVVHLPAGISDGNVDVPVELIFSILGAVPWMLAAGFCGVREAVLAGFLSGLVRGGWGTVSILTPFNMALQAGAAALLLRQNYREWPAQLARHPFIAGMASAVLYGLLRGTEIFSQIGGSAFDALNTTLSYMVLVFVAAGFEAGLAGLVGEVLAERLPDRWFHPRTLEAAPYNRSLTYQMIAGFMLLGIAAGGGLLYGDWLMADRYAREVTTDQMELTAAQIGDSVPYFIQTGRSLIRQYGAEISDVPVEAEALEETLSRQLRLVPFFGQLAVYEGEGERIASSGGYRESAEWELEQGIAAALVGMPQEITIPPDAEGGKPTMVFLAPLTFQGGAPAVLAGWTDLTANPMLLPVVTRLQALEELQAYVLDENGRVLLYPDEESLDSARFPEDLEDGQSLQDTAGDGTRRLLYAHAVEGYPWQVIVTVPKSNVDQLAIQIAVRLSGVMLIVGLLAVILVYLVSKRLTRPIRQMAHVAERIAQGDLDQPVLAHGEDEIGRLSETFESMRRGLRSRLAEMNLLLGVSQRMAASFDLSSVLPAILEELQEVLQAGQIRFVLAQDPMQPDGNLECYHSGEFQADWHKLDEEILFLSRESGLFLLENPARARTVLSLHELTTPINSIAAVPLRDEENSIGVLWLGYQGSHVFSSNEINLLTILAAQLGVSISNVRLYHSAEQERSRLVAILEATPDAVIVIDGKGEVVLANPAAEELFHHTGGKVHGARAEEVITSPELIDLLVYSGKEKQAAEVSIGEKRVMYAAVSEVVDRGLPAGKVCVLSDVTHFKKLEAMKSEFVSTVSHDLKSPLSLMNGYVTMLSMVGDLNRQQDDYVQKIQDGINSMIGLVDNLLDLRRIEAGVGLKLEMVYTADIIEQIIQQQRPQAVNKQISLQAEIGTDMEPVQADPVLLRQAFANLLENAIKYTQPKGSVTIQAGYSGGLHWVKFRDTGAGIAPADQARLFEKFKAVHPEREPDPGPDGMGLGLAIVRSIIEQHGGRIMVESKLGQGSVFTVELPGSNP